jgi:hypothetical protein
VYEGKQTKKKMERPQHCRRISDSRHEKETIQKTKDKTKRIEHTISHTKPYTSVTLISSASCDNGAGSVAAAEAEAPAAEGGVCARP